jgi:hypothetical protein
MKTKTKKKNKIVKTQVKARSKKYESHYLVIVLVVFLLLEGVLITSAQAADWQYGFQVLDMSSSIAQTSADLSVTFEPIANAITGVDQFYQLTATEMSSLLDLSSVNPVGQIATISGGVYEFYQSAATELTALLDLTSIGSVWSGNIAGVSVSTY